MNIALAIAGIATLNLLHRLWLLPRNPMSFDSWGHLYFTLETKRGGTGPFRPIRPSVVGSEDFYYPLLPHWLVGLLPKSFLRHKSWMLNPLFETLFLAIVLATAISGGIPPDWVAAGGLSYVLTPLWSTKLAIGPRVLNFTTRTFSELLYPLTLVVLLFDLSLPYWLAVTVGAILFSAVLLGSKFGVQVVLLVTPLIALLTMNTQLALSLAIAPILALSVSRGGFAGQLRQQLHHLKWYVEELKHGRLPMDSRNLLKHLAEWSADNSYSRNLRRLINNWFARNSFTGMLLRAPHVPTTVALLFLAMRRGVEVDPVLWAPVCAGVVIYLATSLRPLLFLCEAERYVSHVSIFSNVLFVALCYSLDLLPLAWLAMAYGAALSLAERILLRDGVNPDAGSDEDRVVEHLQQVDMECAVIVYPYHVVPPYRIMIDTLHRCVFPVLAGPEHKKAMQELEEYPYINLARIAEVVEHTDANVLIVDKKERAARLKSWSLPDDWQIVDSDFGNLEIYERLD